jgi:N-acetylgalactosamine-6-sulfatase
MIRLLCLLALHLGCSLQAASKPNIIFILADDYGWGDPACYGHPYARTPNIDRLAREGTRFTQFYATGVTCCPARTGLMTGKRPATFAKYPASFGFGDRITVTELMKKAGYATGHFGKWHIGPSMTPGTYGIDLIGSAEENAAPKPVDGGKDTRLFDNAITFLEKHQDMPFYMNVWGHITHHPIQPQQRFVDEFASLKVKDDDFSDYQREKFATVWKHGGDVDDSMRRFLGEAFSMDQDIGRLLAKLDELKLTENTLVIFNSDQGPSSPQDVLRERTAANAAKKPLSPEKARLAHHLLGYPGPDVRGGKHGDYEGGVRVPFIVRWPGKVPAGRVDTQSVLSGTDWLPTLCAITGVTFNADEFDGEDVSASLLGGVHVRTLPLFWKVNSEKADPTLRWQNWKLHLPHRARGEVELYDLSNDPAERHNLASQKPDLVQDLASRLKAWTDSLPKTYEHGDVKEN